MGAVASWTIERELSVSHAGEYGAACSAIELNDRWSMTVIPVGSFEEPGGGGGGGAVTETDALPFMPSLVAVMVADPTPDAVTRPEVELTEAIPAAPPDHVTSRPVSRLPLASRVVAES